MGGRMRADVAMLCVAMFWGLTFPLIRGALGQLSADWFVFLRFATAFVVFLPLLGLARLSRATLRDALWPGFVLGAIAWSSYFSQTIGLQSTGAGRAAFLTGTSVILVPLLSPCFGSGRPRRGDLLAAAVALAGMILLTEPAAGGLRSGDLWVLGCALSYAVYLHVLQIYGRRGLDPTALAFLQVAGVALCAAMVLPLRAEAMPRAGTSAWAGVLVCALFATVLTFWLQAKYQRNTSAERVALIFALEPVFAALFAYWLLGETMRAPALAGAGLILAAVGGSEWISARRSAGE